MASLWPIPTRTILSSVIRFRHRHNPLTRINPEIFEKTDFAQSRVKPNNR